LCAVPPSKDASRKKQRTRADATAPETKEVRCIVLKDYVGQADQPDALAVEKDDIVFLTAEPSGDGWVNVRRERDDGEGIVPQKRVQKAPLPPSPHATARAAPVLSSDEDDEDHDEAPKALELTLEQVDTAIQGLYETRNHNLGFNAGELYADIFPDEQAIDQVKMSALQSHLTKLCGAGVDGKSAAMYEHDSFHDEYNLIDI